MTLILLIKDEQVGTKDNYKIQSLYLESKKTIVASTTDFSYIFFCGFCQAQVICRQYKKS